MRATSKSNNNGSKSPSIQAKRSASPKILGNCKVLSGQQMNRPGSNSRKSPISGHEDQRYVKIIVEI